MSPQHHSLCGVYQKYPFCAYLYLLCWNCHKRPAYFRLSCWTAPFVLPILSASFRLNPARSRIILSYAITLRLKLLSWCPFASSGPPLNNKMRRMSLITHLLRRLQRYGRRTVRVEDDWCTNLVYLLLLNMRSIIVLV